MNETSIDLIVEEHGLELLKFGGGLEHGARDGQFLHRTHAVEADRPIAADLIFHPSEQTVNITVGNEAATEAQFR